MLVGLLIAAGFFFSELKNQTDLLSLSGKMLHVTAGSVPALNSLDGFLCQYINLQLVNAKPQGNYTDHMIRDQIIYCNLNLGPRLKSS